MERKGDVTEGQIEWRWTCKSNFLTTRPRPPRDHFVTLVGNRYNNIDIFSVGKYVNNTV